MRRVLAAFLRHWISAVGVALTTASALLFLFLVALDLLGVFQNPYVGIIIFVIVPALFVIGLLLMPVGLWLERRARRKAPGAEWPRLDLRDAATRRMLGFVALFTVLSLAIISAASFGGVEYTESREFCGQVCHDVMRPEFVAHGNGLHARIRCVSCHVGPGAAAFVSAKLNGTRQLGLVATGKYRRPIPTPIEDMPDVQSTCEHCHAPDRFVGDKIKIFYEHADDEANTQTKTTVRLHVGGPVSGTGSGTGIHWHMNRGNLVEYVAADEKREKISYVRVTMPDGKVREYFADGVKPSEIEGQPRRRMGCLDCHSRPAHPFGTTPERAVDAAMGVGLMNPKIPFIRREAVKALSAAYPNHEVAVTEIERTIRDALNPLGLQGFTEDDLRTAIAVTQAIYRNNVFPSMNIGWGTYPTHLGHMTSAGCFRCHDESHKTSDGVTIRQDCESCHAIE